MRHENYDISTQVWKTCVFPLNTNGAASRGELLHEAYCPEGSDRLLIAGLICSGAGDQPGDYLTLICFGFCGLASERFSISTVSIPFSILAEILSGSKMLLSRPMQRSNLPLLIS